MSELRYDTIFYDSILFYYSISFYNTPLCINYDALGRYLYHTTNNFNDNYTTTHNYTQLHTTIHNQHNPFPFYSE